MLSTMVLSEELSDAARGGADAHFAQITEYLNAVRLLVPASVDVPSGVDVRGATAGLCFRDGRPSHGLLDEYVRRATARLGIYDARRSHGISLSLYCTNCALPRHRTPPKIALLTRTRMAGTTLAAGGLVDWCSRPGLPRPRVSPRELPREQTLEQPQT